MKTFCALATLAAATAVENTAPVISLSLTGNGHGLDSENHDLCNGAGTYNSDTDTKDHDSRGLALRNTVAATPSECVEYDTHVAEAIKEVHESPTRTAVGDDVAHTHYSTSHPHSFAAKGLVTATAAKFPEPTASAYDHHDESHVEIIKTYTYFVISRPACNTFSGVAPESLAKPTASNPASNALSAGTPVNTGTYAAGTENQCAMAQTATNVDLVEDAAGEGDDNLDESTQSHFSQAMRNRRGEFIIKYDATDRAGNQASQLVFAMILVDDECPCLTAHENEALATIQAMDSCGAALMAHKQGGKVGGTYASCATLDRSKIVLNEKTISWEDNYDGTSPTMASADDTVRTHGLKYHVAHEGGYALTSSVADNEQAVYLMVGADAVTTAGVATVEYTTKDYANIFGYGYADNKCVDGVHQGKPTADATQTHCVGIAEGMPATSWTIKDDLAPRIFANPNLDADGADAGTEAGTCGAVIKDSAAYPVDVAFTPLTNDAGRKACHAWNIRRRWCAAADATVYDNLDKCVGWSTTTGQLFAAGAGETCTKEAAKAFHECGTPYKEPGYVCVDMRDSFVVDTSVSERATDYWMEIAGVNDAADASKACLEYHVYADATCMHHTTGNADTDTSDKITYSLSPAGAAGPAITVASEARFGTDFELATATTENGYPLYGKDNSCSTDFTATYTCTDALEQTVSLNRTIEIKDTVDPILEIATAGMSNVNKLEAGAYGLALVSNDDFTDNTNMDHGVHVGGRTNTGEADDQTYINAKDTTGNQASQRERHDWHGAHDAANSQKGMNSHYHDSSEEGDATTAAFLQAISTGSVGSATLNYGGKTWKVDQGVLALRNATSGDVEGRSIVGIAAGVQDSYTIQHSSGFDADEAVITNLVKAHKGFACYDACDGDLTHAKNSDNQGTVNNGVTMTWHHTDCDNANILTSGFNTLIPGTYALKYVCEDECGNSASKCRTILNEDHTKPVLTVLEADDQTYEATREDNYVDAGATCSDEVDGNISQDVEVSGDVVNLARVGVYTIKYNCEDSASNPADEATRKVTVQDTSCPTCVLSVDGTRTTGGSHTTSIEASFPYSDVGAVAQDTLQGSFGICSVWSDQNTAGVFRMEASYKKIVNVEATGTYYITYRVKDSNGNWNDDNKCSEGQTGTHLGDNIRTVVIIDTLRPVIELKYKGTSTTDSNGVVTQASEQVIHRGAQEFADGVGGEPRGAGITGGDANDYLHLGAVHDGGLHNRQVAGDHSVQRTTADENHHTYSGPNALMAEEPATTAVNGWVIGAVASAVSGLALLGYSLRKSAAPVATSVPV